MIRLENITKCFEQRGERLTVFEDLSLELQANAVTAILGPSGCGKTTLLRLIAGLEELTSGSISFGELNHRIGMVFQEYTAFPWLTVGGNVAFGLRQNNLTPHKISETVAYWLEKTSLTEFRDAYPAQLSGGMKQRLAFARALAMEPTLILMDEPFGALDAITTEVMLEFTDKLLNEKHTTAVMVTHDIRQALLISGRVVVLSRPPCRILLDTLLRTQHTRRPDEREDSSDGCMESRIRTILRSQQHDKRAQQP